MIVSFLDLKEHVTYPFYDIYSGPLRPLDDIMKPS